MKIKQKLINLIFLISLTVQIIKIIQANNDELFGDKSIIRKLRNQLGSFKSEIKIKNETINDNYKIFKEEYNFKDKNGRLYNSDKSINLYFNDLTEYYLIVKNLYCYSASHYKLIYSHFIHTLLQWSPKESINLSREFQILGPTHFLFALISDYDENKELINCVNIDDDSKIRCDIFYEESAKIEYYFKEDHNQLKMFPLKIKTFKKSSDKDNEYKFYKELKYTKFEYSFNGDNNRINSNLPIGSACQRVDNYNKYPKIETNFGSRFNLEYDIEFNYLDLNNIENNIFVKKQYSGKWFKDDDYLFSIFDCVDENKQKIRTYYDLSSELAYDIIENKNCIKYNLKNEFNYSLNWYYMQDLQLFPNLFNFKQDRSFKFSYLGEYKLNQNDNQLYHTFEKKILFKYNKNSGYGRKNYNGLNPDNGLILHYYHPFNKKIPSLIILKLNDYDSKHLGTIKIKINKHTLASSSDSFNEVINLDQCFKNSIDYKELNFQFKDKFNKIKLFNQNYIKYEFGKLIAKNLSDPLLTSLLSPLRIRDIKLTVNKNLINLNVKIIGPLNDDLKYFKKINGQTLNELKDNELIKIKDNIDNEQLCSELCLANEDCGVFSFKKQNKICKLWIDSSFYLYGPKRYNWDKVQIRSEINSTLSKRLIRFYIREHQSIDNILKLIKKSINKKQFNLILKKSSNDKEIKFNYFMKSDLSNKFKYSFLLYFVILIIITIIIGTIKYRKRYKINVSDYPSYVNFRNTK